MMSLKAHSCQILQMKRRKVCQWLNPLHRWGISNCSKNRPKWLLKTINFRQSSHLWCHHKSKSPKALTQSKMENANWWLMGLPRRWILPLTVGVLIIKSMNPFALQMAHFPFILALTVSQKFVHHQNSASKAFHTRWRLKQPHQQI